MCRHRVSPLGVQTLQSGRRGIGVDIAQSGRGELVAHAVDVQPQLAGGEALAA